ncbi:MAG: DUF1016 N-terminal domain-containing protein [Lachnospiraceae bacterium]|nr:DUF1016 N-terminal domain-containing protein [Lachnospiraceae bacterium]
MKWELRSADTGSNNGRSKSRNPKAADFGCAKCKFQHNLSLMEYRKSHFEKTGKEGGGAKVIDRMAKDLKDAFPEMYGFSPRDIQYMRKFAESWPDFEIVQLAVAQIPWRANISLMDKLKDEESRIWYAHKAIENGWSKTILDLQIEGKLMGRSGRSVNNFPAALPPMDSDLVNQVFKDPYLFDFLGTDMPWREVEIEKELE